MFQRICGRMTAYNRRENLKTNIFAIPSSNFPCYLSEMYLLHRKDFPNPKKRKQSRCGLNAVLLVMKNFNIEASFSFEKKRKVWKPHKFICILSMHTVPAR